MSNLELKLFYFRNKGRAEVARLLLAAAEQTYEDIRMTDEEWLKFKPSTPYGQIPMLEVNGAKFVQSLAINSFLAREFGFSGKNNLENFKIDEIIHLIEDYFAACVSNIFYPKTDDVRAAERKKLIEETGPRLLGFLEGNLQKSGTGFFVGDRMTLADVAVFDAVTGMLAEFLNVTEAYPLLQKNIEMVRSIPGIARHMATRPITPH
ncbi:glutathione S-transferase 4-like [Physella acuta]|uniref:glutathione S-transferase 4-like n=1 Tax=Physella acuta TaxID=109671 RepID=UPI0027DDE4C0|nr:glutathione S-transferase 4-like [Physella acuta]